MNNANPLRMAASVVGLLTALAFVALMALPAGAQLPNKDTAEDRQDNSFGTRDSGSKPYFETTGDGDASWGVIPEEKPEPSDPYDDIIITVDPQVKWPPSGNETSITTTSHTTANATQDANSTDTTTTTTTW